MMTSHKQIKERHAGLDIIRAVAVTIILVFHYNSRFSAHFVEGFCPILFRHANGTFGQVGTSMFFLLSGAALIERYKDFFNVKQYFFRRFVKIFPLYWLTWIVFYIFYVLTGLRKPLWAGSPARLLFTVIGIDGWLLQVTRTFSLIGEWFTGVIIIIYILFPFLRYLYKHHFAITTYVIVILYLLNLKFRILAFGGGGAMSITCGIMAFWAGMTIYKYENIILDVKPYYYFIPFLCLCFIPLPFQSLIKLYVMGGSLYLTILTATKSMKKCPSPMAFLCKYSYPIYLVHHRVYYIFRDQILGKRQLSTFEAYAFFAGMFVVILLLSVVLTWAVDRIADIIRSCARRFLNEQ